MAASDWKMNRFERILFRIALIFAAVIVAVRVGAIAVIWYAHHYR